LLSFTNVYFFESGLFNGLRPIQVKKIAPLGFADGRVRRASRHLSPLDAPDFHQRKYTGDRGSAKDLLAATGLRSRKV
jgi:hypothetical protein